MSENNSDKEIQSEDQVKLKPIFGIKPGRYLAVIYGAALLIVLFLTLVNPGIKKPGVMVTVKSEPWGAAVSVDGVYMGAAPCDIFIAKGQRIIELSLPGFSSKQIEKKIGSRLFASAIFPLRAEIREELFPIAETVTESFVNEAAEYAAWSFAGEPGAAYQIPLSLSEGVYRFGPAAANPAVWESMNGTIAASGRFAATRAGLRDLIRAKTLLDNNGLSPSPLSLLASAGEAIAFLGENPGAAQWLSETLQGEPASLVRSSSWHRTQTAKNLEGRQAGTLQAYGNMRFLGITVTSEGRQTGRFYIAENPVSGYAWRLFINDRPEWSSENRETLVKNGLADSQYMAEWELPGGSENTAVLVSWHAVQAWCEWYNSRLSAAEGLEARLPTEAEWELAAGTGLARQGEFWEWCDDLFAPLGFLTAQASAAAALGSPERSLRGGSWINIPGTAGIETRASLPPSFCSPFVSFRPVLAPRGSRL